MRRMIVNREVEMARLNGVLKGKKPVLVQFYANWCPHCQRMRPILDALEKENSEHLIVERYDIDAPQNARLLEYYRIQSVPTFLLFYDGDQVWRQSGEMPSEQLEEVVRKYE